MDVTVAIPTWNRSALLARTLERMTALRLPPELEWELLVVDNASTDDTQAVLTGFEDRLPLRSAFEEQSGVANARNRAVREARGTYMVWADDDVKVCAGWLDEYVAAIRRRPDAVLFGGPILPRFEGTGPPGWLKQAWPAVQSAYGVREMGGRPVRLTSEGNRVPYGANFAISSRVQRRFPYDPKLGRSPAKDWSGGEEVEVFKAVLDAGHEGWWVPGAAVEHHVPLAYQTVRYLRRYYVAQGRCEVRVNPPPAGARLFGRPRWYWREAIRAELTYRWRRLTSPPERWAADLRRAAWAWGKLLEAGRTEAPVIRPLPPAAVDVSDAWPTSRAAEGEGRAEEASATEEVKEPR